ncbi:MAG: glycosyltransferase [Chloracidobacterium sp.]|nr:glycosyltransferase [Chloracidobacterium sp.]
MAIVILHLIPSLSGGGAERQLVDVVRNTSNEDFSHVVCCWGASDFFGRQLRSAGVKVIDLGIDGKHPWVAAARRVNSVVDEIRPDIMHSWLYDADIVSRIVKLRNRGLRLITSLQSPNYEPETIRAGGWSSTKVGILRWIDRISIKFAAPYFVACSEFVAGSSRRWLGIDPARISVIFNSVDPNTLTTTHPERTRADLGFVPGDFIFMSVGRLDKGKGYRFLIDAFSKVLQNVPSAKLVLVGTGPDEAELRTHAAALMIDERVVFAGRRSDIGDCLRIADVFVFPTLFEGLGIALIEAMAMELPCIATDLPVLREIIDDGVSGQLVRAGSVEDWVRSLTEMYSDEILRARLGAAAGARVRSKFYSNVLIPQWEALYSRISAGDI